MNAMAKKAKQLPDGYATFPVAPKILNVPQTTFRRHIDNGDIPYYLVDDELVVKLDEAITVLTSPEKTILKTGMRVMAGLKELGLYASQTKVDLFS
jgi:hypothetical protein